jgi:hypothetical protein
VFLFYILGVANAQENLTEKSKANSIALGVGNHYGWAGIGYTKRFSDESSLLIGVGSYGFGLAGRYYPFVDTNQQNQFYTQVGFSPVMQFEDLSMLYGPDFSVGWETNKKGFHFNTALGMGYAKSGIFIADFIAVFDLGLGYNFGER